MTPSPSHAPKPSLLRPEPQPAFGLADAQWGRPVFKAPPLSVRPPIEEIRDFIASSRERMTAGGR